MVTSPLCPKCGRILHKDLREMGEDYHPTCKPTTANEALGIELLAELTDVIRWTDNNSARSVQTAIGPSELGSLCDRKIAYRLANVPEANWWSDPLPAIVGTAVHHWLENAINEFSRAHFMDRWMTEITVQPDPMVKGHVDLYDAQLAAVIDWKTVSPTKLKAWKADGPPEHYKDQVNLYGRGIMNAGLAVARVVLVAVPRSGWLKDMQIWVDDYRPERAQACLDRMYGIANTMIAAGDDLAFEDIPAAPDSGCSYCPWYRGGDRKADMSGCSGNIAASRAKYGKGLVKGA
jgi:PD-(D/E)XK nuclease superfamily protein